MSWSKLGFLATSALLAASCSSGGRNYWLYPEPRLPESEEAVFVAHENHRVLAIDGERITSSCTGEGRRPQAYNHTEVVCRFHVRPGQHSVSFHPSLTSREVMSMEFAARPGKIYGLTWTGCGAYLDMDGHRKTCRVQVEEIETPAGGG